MVFKKVLKRYVLSYCLINEQECFLRFKATTNSIIYTALLVFFTVYIKNTNKDTTTIDTALLVFFI